VVGTVIAAVAKLVGPVIAAAAKPVGPVIAVVANAIAPVVMRLTYVAWRVIGAVAGLRRGWHGERSGRTEADQDLLAEVHDSPSVEWLVMLMLG
jgi:hypothetical protein